MNTPTTEIYTLSLHDALPIWHVDTDRRPFVELRLKFQSRRKPLRRIAELIVDSAQWLRSEEHTSELQSRGHLVCRLLLEKKKKKHRNEKILSRNQVYYSLQK